MDNYVYVLKREDDQDDLMFCSNKKVPSDQLMMLMLEHSAEWCETYNTSGHQEQEKWELLSILGASQGFGAFAGTPSH